MMRTEDIIIVACLVLILIYMYNKSYHSSNVENMAPLGFGTFRDNYPRGECRTGNYMKRKPCETGNCHLGSSVSDKQYCMIQCAQDPDPKERQECFEVCMKTIC